MDTDDPFVGRAVAIPPGAIDFPGELVAGPQPPLLDADTAKAVRTLCWTLCWLLWFGCAVTVLLVLMVAVAVVQGSLPG